MSPFPRLRGADAVDGHTAGRTLQQRIDQPVHAQRFFAVYARLTPCRERIQKILPYAAMVIVRKGHWVSAGSASGAIGRKGFTAPILPSDFQSGPEQRCCCG